MQDFEKNLSMQLIQLKNSLNNFALNRVINRLHIEVSEIDSIAVIGAAALVYNHKRFVEVL